MRSNEQVFDEGMNRLVQGLSKMVDEPFGEKRGRDDSKFEDSMKHLILRLRKKQAFADTSDESIKNSMKHMALRLKKKEDWSLDGPETNAKRIENISRHLKLRLSKRYNGLLSFLEREATNQKNDAELSKVQEPKSVENEHVPLNSLYNEGLPGEQRAESDKHSVDAVERRSGLPFEMKYKMLGKRIGK